jgi:hypothetical protein
VSIEAVAIALHHSQAKGTAKLVLIGIANHDGDAGSFPKVATLARYANVHPRRIPEAIAQLVALGEIRVEQKRGGVNVADAIKPNLYHITLDCPPQCDGTRRHQLLDEQGYAMKFGRSYQGAYTGPREKDPEAVERGKKSWATRNGEAVDNGAQEAAQDSQGPSDGNSTSDENSTRSGDANSTSPGDENSTTKNHTKNHPENPALVPSVTRESPAVDNSPKGAYCEDGKNHGKCQWMPCECNCHGGIRGIVPALPKAKPRANDATPGTKDKKDPQEELKAKSRHEARVAMLRAALRGELTTNEAKDDGVTA